MNTLTILDFLNTTSKSEKELFKNTLKTLNSTQEGQSAEHKIATLANILLEKSSEEPKYLFIVLVSCLNAMGDYSTEITPAIIRDILQEKNTEQLVSFFLSTSENKELPPNIMQNIDTFQEMPTSELGSYQSLLLEKINCYI